MKIPLICGQTALILRIEGRNGVKKSQSHVDVIYMKAPLLTFDYAYRCYFYGRGNFVLMPMMLVTVQGRDE